MPRLWLFTVAVLVALLAAFTRQWLAVIGLYLVAGALWTWHLRAFPALFAPYAVEERRFLRMMLAIWPLVVWSRVKEWNGRRSSPDRFIAGNGFFGTFLEAVSHAQIEATKTGKAVWVSDTLRFRPTDHLLGEVSYVSWVVESNGQVRRVD